MEKDKHIFISYNREDIELTRKVKNTLVEFGLSVWTDEGIPPDTGNWIRDIQKALEQAYCVICILTPNTSQSDWVYEELHFARVKKISIYMILLVGSIEAVTIFGFSTSHVTDLTDHRIYYNRLKNLAETIQKKHVDKQDKTKDFFTPETFNRLDAAIREEEEKQKADIKANEIHMIRVFKGAASTPRTKYKIDKTPCIIGRDENSSAIVIRDYAVSRNHCDLLYTKQGMYIRDLRSTNGTFVDGIRVLDKQLLSDGSRITFAPPEQNPQVELTYFHGVKNQ